MANKVYRFFKDHKIKIFFFCLFIALIIGLSTKYGIPTKIEASASSSTYTQSPIIISPIDIVSSTDTNTDDTDTNDTDTNDTDNTNISTQLPIRIESPTTLSPTVQSTTSSVKTLNPSPIPNIKPLAPTDFPTFDPTYAPTKVPTKVPTTASPVLNGKEGDLCYYNDTCLSRVCANTHQSIDTIYHNTCLPSSLSKGSVCYKDESCKSYSCIYNWSFDKYICN
jgi:hypothetical protein